jgi:hypothetical protein
MILSARPEVIDGSSSLVYFLFEMVIFPAHFSHFSDEIFSGGIYDNILLIRISDISCLAMPFFANGRVNARGFMRNYYPRTVQHQRYAAAWMEYSSAY